TPDGAERQIASGGFPLHSCVHAPVGDWIARASRNLPSAFPGPGFRNIAPSAIVLASATGTLTTLTDTTTANLSHAWSPDGRQLYFVSNREGPRDVYVVDVTASGGAAGARRVTTGLGAQSIAFGGNGERMAYVTYTARANIWSLPLPSGAPVDTSQ